MKHCLMRLAHQDAFRFDGLRKLKRAVRLICLFVSPLLMAGCSGNSNPNAMNEIELRNGDLHATFAMPAAYKAKRGTESLMFFRCRYPSMQPLDPDGVPQGNDVDVYITLSDHPGRTERMVAEAPDHFDPKRPGLDYYAGKQGHYDLYHSIPRVRKGTANEVTTYVFKAQDGQLVGVEDPGDWSVKYEAHRKLGDYLQIHYLISKPLGNDFIKIDETVTSFINNHLKIKPNKG